MTPPTITRFAPGTLVAGRYQVVRPLGSGGMAEVHEAVDRRLGRTVAVKVIRPELASDHRAAARFRREARASAALSHPGIVPVHDVGTHDGSPFMVMEVVRGRTLADVLAAGGPLPPERVARIGRGIARALAAAHRKGVVHRDVKPGNVMIARGGGVRVLDFGIARVIPWTPLTEARAVQGTAEYMSPEQVRGDEVDARSDVYSLGVVMFELLAGRTPFTGDAPVSVAFRHLEEEAPRVRSLRPEVPEALDDILTRCLAKDPKTRFATADAVAADLDRFLSGAPPVTASLPEAPPTRVTSPPRRRRRFRLGWVTALVVAVVAASLAAAAWFGRPEGASASRPRVRPPTSLSATSDCAGFLKASVNLAWIPSSSRRADGYEIYRATDQGGPWEQIALVTGGETSGYLDEDVNQGTDYFYSVRTTAGGRTSRRSAPTTAQTPIGCLF